MSSTSDGLRWFAAVWFLLGVNLLAATGRSLARDGFSWLDAIGAALGAGLLVIGVVQIWRRRGRSDPEG